jgi:polyferredoxin
MTDTDLMAIHERNARVENDKAWETSWTRRLCIAALTYIILVIYLPLLGLEKSYLHATVPVIGYLLSTQTLPIAKKLWLEKIRFKGNHA